MQTRRSKSDESRKVLKRDTYDFLVFRGHLIWIWIDPGVSYQCNDMFVCAKKSSRELKIDKKLMTKGDVHSKRVVNTNDFLADGSNWLELNQIQYSHARNL